MAERAGPAGAGGRGGRRGAESPGLSPPASGTERSLAGVDPCRLPADKRWIDLGAVGVRGERSGLAAPAPGTARLRDPSFIAPGAGVVVVASARERTV